MQYRWLFDPRAEQATPATPIRVRGVVIWLGASAGAAFGRRSRILAVQRNYQHNSSDSDKERCREKTAAGQRGNDQCKSACHQIEAQFARAHVYFRPEPEREARAPPGGSNRVPVPLWLTLDLRVDPFGQPANPTPMV